MADALGWRLKLGALAPSTNTIVEPDYDDMRPLGVTNHMSRIFTPDAGAISNESFRAGIATIGGNVLDAVRSVMTCKPGHLVMGISALSFFGGAKGADAFVRQVADVAGIGVSVGSHATSAALRAYGGIQRIAIHPDQVGPINAVFTPTAAEVAHARAVLAAFETAGNGGVASLEGNMLDRPHQKLAARVLERAKAAGLA